MRIARATPFCARKSSGLGQGRRGGKGGGGGAELKNE